MKLTDKRILVTGADGFIGFHLTETLLDMGCRVRALSLYNSFNDWGWLEQGLEQCIDWFTRPENLARYKIDIYNV